MTVFPTKESYPPATAGTLVVWGLLASYPFGGMTWQVLQYLVGLRRLGFDVWYVEDSDKHLLDPETIDRTNSINNNVRYLIRQLEMVGLEDRWVFRAPGEDAVFLGGCSNRNELAALYRRADAGINLCGAQEWNEAQEDISTLVLVETDPVVHQVLVAKGVPETIEKLDRYSFLFTYAENLGNPDCRVPVARYRWIPTRPPVLTDWWGQNLAPPGNRALTTVCKLRHKRDDLTWQGEAWRWSKHHEFYKVVDLPQRSALPLEMSVSAISEEERAKFESLGWITGHPRSLKDPLAYRNYIIDSLGEFTVTKEQYAKPRSGWFSDRSVCYLGAGRPVITQETGFSAYIPTGEGLFAFSTAEEAADATRSIAADYERHSRAAYEIAREYFAGEKVLSRMLGAMGLK